MPYINISKRREAERRYYRKNVKLYLDKNIRRKKELTDFVISLKQVPCLDCGVQYPYYVMDFHHRDQKEKIASIAALVSHRRFSKQRILEEVKKCDLLCANCHRIRSYSKIKMIK